MKIGVFGGTFNPIHYGHLRAAEDARELLCLDKVLFIPSGNPPLKTDDVADASQRYAMARLAVAGNEFFEVLDIECVKPGKSYTVDTLKALCDAYDTSDLYFMLGIDAFLDIPNWWMPDRLVSMTNFAVLSRPGSMFTDLVKSPYLAIEDEILSGLDIGKRESFRSEMKTRKEVVLLNVTPLEISATGIRGRVCSGRSVKYLLPEKVESFIISNRLYAAVPDGLKH
ncbi:MAG: nicotinate-nucleotide adenylyltransferase [Nitrospirae bacterium]|nr:nicotinate-nucleotide adenylyltransferase [Nitrospirota bacterium]